MAKRDIDKSPPLTTARDGAFYSADDVMVIIEAAGSDIPPGRRDELVRRLERAADRWISDDAIQHSPTPRMLEERFARIERAAANLLKMIGAGPQGTLSSIPGPILDRLRTAAAKKATRLGKSDRNLLRESVGGVVQIKRWSAKQVQIEIEREAKREDISRVKNPRKTRDYALNKWIMELVQIYSDFTGRKPTLSWSDYTENYSGLFFEFVRAANGTREPGAKAAKGVVGRTKSNIALGKAIQRVTTPMDF